MTDTRNIELDKKVDQQVQKRDALVKQLDTMKEAHKKVLWKTNCTSATYGIKIQVDKLPKIIEFAGTLLSLKDKVSLATAYFKLNEKQKSELNSSMVDGYSIQDWLDDCERRISIIEMRNLETRIEVIFNNETFWMSQKKWLHCLVLT